MAIRDLEDYALAWSIIRESVPLWREQGDLWGLADALHGLALVAYRQGDKSGIVLSLQYQGLLGLLQDNDLQAQSFYEEGLILARETGPMWVTSNYLLGLASVAARRDQLERAARLCGAARAHLSASASFWDAFERSYYERIVTLARPALGELAFSEAMEQGRAMIMEQAIAYALENNR